MKDLERITICIKLTDDRRMKNIESLYLTRRKVNILGL